MYSNMEAYTHDNMHSGALNRRKIYKYLFARYQSRRLWCCELEPTVHQRTRDRDKVDQPGGCGSVQAAPRRTGTIRQNQPQGPARPNEAVPCQTSHELATLAYNAMPSKCRRAHAERASEGECGALADERSYDCLPSEQRGARRLLAQTSPSKAGLMRVKAAQSS